MAQKALFVLDFADISCSITIGQQAACVVQDRCLVCQ
jgi:hypothetical protein